MATSPLANDADAERPSRSTRARPAKTPLSEEAIVNAALKIAGDDGLDAVTMRRVAAELDTGAASLYVYVANRNELLHAMIDRVLARIPLLTPDPLRWREQIYELMVNARDALEAHPGMSTVLLGEPPMTEVTMDGAENLLGILQGGGIAAQDAAWACDTLMLIMTASASEADVRRAGGFAGFSIDTEQDALKTHLHTWFRQLPRARYPLLHAHADEMVTGDVNERFRFAIETFLDGLVARSQRSG